ncbi:YgaP-like transmembrane domain [Candidatus Thiodiazotropha sp. LNASS1]|uniref:YgaP-like transmembrane domain n=1 Tax=Candidatus Thiodiazotropha sp. LNASS1 TaxID=3096260 RepID=UPI003473BF7D
MDLLKKNVGIIDRVVRIIIGILLIGNIFYGLQSPVGWIGLILLLTGLFATCPLYSALSLDTRSTSEKVGLK